MSTTPPSFRETDTCANCRHRSVINKLEELNNGKKTIMFTHGLKCKIHGFIIQNAHSHTCDDWNKA